MLVMKKIDWLNVSLNQEDLGVSILSEIKHEMVSKKKQDLKSYYSTFQKLNKRYKAHVKPMDNDNYSDYAKPVTEAFSATKRRYNK